MTGCFFCSDLHGRPTRYRALLERIAAEAPAAVFLGGDLLPHAMDRAWAGDGGGHLFVEDFLAPGCRRLRDALGADYPRLFLILGNDDPCGNVEALQAGEAEGLWEYVHGRAVAFGRQRVLGYNCIPPSPFLLKDWERYDVSRFVDPGCIPPEEGRRGDGLTARELRQITIRGELADLCGEGDLSDAILLCHCPPYRTLLDRAALDGRSVDHAPLDPHIGSIAIRELIESRPPAVGLFGHVHESARLAGSWQDRLGGAVLLGGAHDGPELALVRFDPDDPAGASRELV